MSKGKKVQEIRTGRIGVVTKTMGNCLFAKMEDDGTERSGAKKFWKLCKETSNAR